MPLSDTEVLCGFMEARPSEPPDMWTCSNKRSPGGWWRAVLLDAGINEWRPREITLNECREIELRLTAMQWHGYKSALFSQYADQTPSISDLISLEAAQKIAALSIVLRPIVEAPNAA